MPVVRPVTLIAIVTLTMGLVLAVGGGALEITGHYEQGELSFVVWVTEWARFLVSSVRRRAEKYENECWKSATQRYRRVH
jgi:hypothetical protein